jgi:hypothetical protein
MDRSEFLKKSAQGCLACCGALAGLSAALAADGSDHPTTLSTDLGKRIVDGAKTSDWRRAEKSLSWIRNILQHIDEQLDEPARTKLLNACGRSCYMFAEGVADERPKSREETEGFLHALEQDKCKIERRPGATIIEFAYGGHQNPQGLSLREGYCLCPIVEADLDVISPSYCNCSAGYVKEMIERQSGREVRRVEVLESVKRGGKDCRFLVELAYPTAG